MNGGGFTNYIKHVLGIDVVYEKADVGHFPNFIYTRYDIRIASLDDHRVLLLYPKSELEQIETLKKHIARIQKDVKLPVILMLERLTFRQKEYLIRDKIPFVVEGKQIYLPFLAIYLQEMCSAEKPKQEKILPSAQMLLLHFIYNGTKELSTSQAAIDLKLTPTSISRASRQLEEMELISTRKEGVQKILFSTDSPRDLFQKAEKKLVNPVKRTVYIPDNNISEELLKGGYSALAEYSMLNTPSVRCYATDKISQWKDVMTNYLQDSKTQVAVEMWRYDPKILSNAKYVDELSLALALRDDADERVEEAVDEMIKNLWERIDGYRY